MKKHMPSSALQTHASSRRRLAGALSISLAYTALLLLGALTSGSLALQANMGHMMAHTGVLLVAFVASRVAARAPNDRFSSGYGKVEIIGGYTNALLLLGVSLFVGMETLERVHDHADVVINTSLMGLISMAGLVLHFFSAWILYGGRKESMNVYAAFLHIFFDIISTVLTLIAGFVVYKTSSEAADTAVGLVIAVLVFISAIRLLWKSSLQLMDAVPDHIPYADVVEALHDLQHIKDVHNVLIRPGSYPGEVFLSAHLVLDTCCVDAAHWNSCRLAAERMLRERFGITHTVLQLEAPEHHTH